MVIIRHQSHLFHFYFQKLGISRSPKNSTDLSNELKIAIGCDPSAMFCKSEKPDVPACNSKCQLNLGFHLLLWGTLMVFDYS